MPIWKDVVEASGQPNLNEVQFKLIEVAKSDPRHSIIQTKIPYPVSRVFSVQNPKLYAKFVLKKEQYGHTDVRELFHDTEISNVESIMLSNLNWRRATRVKYGQGVSFATTASYAYKHSNGFNTNKAMIICDVLVGKMGVYSNRNHPPSDVDTTISADANVIVKYCDDEFYPKFVVHYTGHVKQGRHINYEYDPYDFLDDSDDYDPYDYLDVDSD